MRKPLAIHYDVLTDSTAQPPVATVATFVERLGTTQEPSSSETPENRSLTPLSLEREDIHNFRFKKAPCQAVSAPGQFTPRGKPLAMHYDALSDSTAQPPVAIVSGLERLHVGTTQRPSSERTPNISSS